MLRDAGFNQNSNDFDIVVLGFDREFTFEKMTEACQLVHNGLPYIATHPDFYCPTEKGPEPDCGALIEMVRLTTKKDPHWIGGKPSKMMIDVIKQRVGGLEGMIFFGDRLYTDIMMSSTAKISGVLVLSGETTIKDLEDPEAQKLPNFVLDSVRDIL
jgi:ribonucleotide monophosphatase NagD (HAD superfamily)